jgi:hypothetical protein
MILSKAGDAYVSYYGGQDGQEKESSGAGNGCNAQQETNGATTEGDREEGSSGAMGFVYFFETEDSQFIKIGFAVNVDRRMGQVSPLVPMRLLGYFPASPHTELWLHHKFKQQRYIGDWFRTSPELLIFIDTLGVIRDMPQERDITTPDSMGEKIRLPEELLELFRKEGKRGGRLGGPARAKALTPAKRKKIARKAAEARWGTKKK